MRISCIASLALLFCLSLPACTSTAVQVTQLPKLHLSVSSTPSSLRSLAQVRNIQIGTAVSLEPLQSEAPYRDTLRREFNLLTPENAMKFAAIHPAPPVYSFRDADTIVAFASVHGLAVRGHNLVWYQVVPSWVYQEGTSRDALLKILHDHIFTVVSHYRGQVNIWDVVNEAVDGNGALRNSIWLQRIGPDYIDWAFRWAHEANPEAQLYYNDNGGEGSGLKSDAIYRLVKGLLQRGVPISGVGLQMHVSIDSFPKPEEVLANMRRLAALGLAVQITEMDVEIQGDARPLEQKLLAQAQVYADMLHVCLSAPNCKAFVTWGFTDRHSWIPEFTGHADAPLLFDAAYTPKPAYFALISALKHR